MGRAYEVRKASIQKTGAIKAKLYSLYAREIYQLAKTGGTDIETNSPLKRLIEKAKKDQIPNDIIKRAIDKVNSGIDENYTSIRYEIFGPAGSTLIVTCFTDNVNRTLSHIRPPLNKTGGKMGVTGSVIYMYDHLSIIRFSEIDETAVIDALINNDIDVDDIEVADNNITVYGLADDFYRIKETLKELKPDINFIVEEISYIAKEKIKLNGEDLQIFTKMVDMLEEVEDVQDIYHNVEI